MGHGHSNVGPLDRVRSYVAALLPSPIRLWGCLLLDGDCQILPEITDDVWPDHELLPRWKNFLAIRHGSSRVHGTLGAFVNSNQIQPRAVLFPAYTVQLIELGLRWNAEARSSMKKMEEHMLDNFKFTELQDCQSANVSAQQGCQPVKEEAMSSTGDRRSQGNGTVEGRRKWSMSALEHKKAAETQTGGEIKRSKQ